MNENPISYVMNRRAECARLWVRGFNTAEIAVKIGLPVSPCHEFAVHNTMRYWMPLAKALRT